MTAKPNAVVAQSGGPTTVINSSACGVIQEAGKSGKIGKVFGATNGVLGVLKEELFDININALLKFANLCQKILTAIIAWAYINSSMSMQQAGLSKGESI